MPAIKNCLWFRTEAEQAAEHYLAIFPSSRVVQTMRGGDAVVAVEVELDGRPFLLLNGRRSAAFTDATSFVVPCATQAEVDRYWAALTDGGEEGQCGWLVDRFGVSWQVVPDGLTELLFDPDPARAGRAMQAMLSMRKLDIGALRTAATGS